MTDKRVTRDLERELRRQPDNLVLRLRLAAAYRGDGRTAEAVQLYRSVAVAYHGQRRLAQAIAVCRSVLELEPGQPETLTLLSELEAMRPDDAGAEPLPTGLTPALGSPALGEGGEWPERAPDVAAPEPLPPADDAPSRPAVRVLDEEVAIRELRPVSRPALARPPRPLMTPPPPAPPLGRRRTPHRPSSAGLTPTPLPAPVPYHDSGDDSLAEITVPPAPRRSATGDDAETRIAPPRIGAPGGVDDAETRIAAPRIAAPRATDDDAPTRIADDAGWNPARATIPGPMAPMAPPQPPPILTARASTPTIDVTAELETRRRPRLDAHELELLGAPPITEPVARVEGVAGGPPDRDTHDTHDDEEPTNPPGPSSMPADLVAFTREGGPGDPEAVWSEEATDPRAHHDVGRIGTGDDTRADDRTLEEDLPTGVGEIVPGPLFERGFGEALEGIGPDGTSLEGPDGGLAAVFDSLPEAARADLQTRLIARRALPGEAIVREGERGDSCFVIRDGEVRVMKSDPLGRADGGGAEPIEVARLGEGALFGEFALLADRRRHATVEAVTACELYEVPRRALRELAATYPEVGPALERFYRERLLATLLAAAPLFQGLPEDQRLRLLARFVPLHADSGHHVVTEGERSGGLYLIVLGAVDIVKRDADGRTVLLATLREGAYFGEMSLLSGQPASASVIAAGPLELACLPPRDFYDVVAGNPTLWTAMRREAGARQLENARILAGDTPAS